ncbi:MAG: GAF domain-containing protein [Bacillati bacterium ANGP1]|uniref:GAF domain-containing protein n=1 Tax=Candidatus Segetimicrobium genomatis TaxID=2569760 RepID=A0A537KXQ4_9BACT|nr:MAG: GAF domain-containing protein [Terrabacteria group bacterium ANGP1]
MNRLRVLVVEDRPADAELMAAELQRAGFTFDWQRVDSERDFLSQLNPHPDIILADFHMPQFTGLRALQILKDRGLDIPLIIVSGSIGEEVAVNAMQQGASDYLLKDRLIRLGAAVNRALEAKHLRDEERKAKEELAMARNLLHTMVTTVPDYITVKDLESRYMLVNDAYANFLGKATSQELVGKTAFDVFPHELAAQYAEADRAVLRTEQPMVKAESRTVDSANNVRWHSTTRVPLRNGAGQLVGVLNISRDITEQKHADEQIERQLETLSALYATAQKLSQSLDLDQLARYVVETAVKTFGARFAWIGHAEPGGAIRRLAHWPDKDEYLRDLAPRWDESPAGQGPSGRAIRSGFPVVVDNIASDASLIRRDILTGLGVKGAGAFPLISRDKPFGVLVLHGDQDNFFGPARTEFFQAFANQAAAALENARLFAEAGERLQQLQALRNIDMAITASLDLRVTLNVILDQVTTHLKTDAATVLLFDPYSQTLRFEINRGFRGKALRHANLRLGEGHAGRAAMERRVISVPDLAAEMSEFARSVKLPEEEFVSYFAVPLIAKGQVKGVLEVLHRAPLNPTQDWLSFLEALAGQAAIAIDNSTLFDNLQRVNTDLTMAYDTTLEGWSKALDLRDKETEGHTLRVTKLTERLARALHVGDQDRVHIRRGALLHDIGKMGIPDSILLKPGPLTDEEWVVMKKHPTYAYELLSPIHYLRLAVDIPYCHHEKWDGSGYPRGLKGEEIPVASRVFAVIDVYDALTSDRPYRRAWPKEKALAYIREQAGKHFDPAVVATFLEMEL